MKDKKDTICLFFDFDGTTFVDGIFPKEIEDAIKNAQKKGAKIYMNTGRSKPSLFQDLKKRTDIRFDGYLCAFSCMYLGNEGEETIFEHHMNMSDVENFIDYCEKYSYWATVDIEGYGPHTIELHGHITYSDKEKKEICDKAREFIKGQKIVKFCVYPPVSVNYVAKNLTEENPNVDWIRTERGYECTLKNFGKGILLNEFAKVTGYNPDNFIVFGDSENDINMFEHAKTSVAMAHSPKNLKDLATYVATTKYGVAEYLNKIFKND